MSAGRLCTAGVDLGGTKLLGLVLDSEGRVGDEQRLPTPEGADALLDAFVTLVGQLRDGVAVESVGVGAPGLGDRASRVLELAGGDFHDVRGEHVAAAAREGDSEARKLMDRYAWWVARGLANLANAFDPETIVVGGGMLESVDLFLEQARAHFR